MSKKSKLNFSDIRSKKKTLVYDGYFKMYEYSCEHRLYNGQWSESIIREVYERGDAVVVLPIDIQQKKVVFIEQFRAPLMYKDDEPWLIELVAGVIEQGEEPLDVAHRELREETGLVAENIKFIHAFFSSPGGSTEKIYFFIAYVDASQASGFHGLAEEQEDIRVFTEPFSEVRHYIEQGKIKNAMTLTGLQWLLLNESSL